MSVSLFTKKKEKEEPMKKEVRKSGKKKRGNNKNQKKNKVSPLGNDSKSSFLSVNMCICLQHSIVM